MRISVRANISVRTRKGLAAMDRNRLRVLTVLDSLSVGGSETHALSLIRSLRRAGIRWSYAGCNGPLYEAFAKEACSIHAVNLSPWALMQESTRESAELKLKRIMITRQINVVHVHQTPSGTVAAAVARKCGIPVVFTVHGMYYSTDQLRLTADNSDVVIAVSKPVQAYLSAHDINSVLVPNGVDPSVFYPVTASELRSSLGIPGEAIVIVYASRLAWDKAIVCSLLMKSIRAMHFEGALDVRLVVAGDGSQSDEIRKQADAIERDSGTKLVHIVGNQGTMRNYYALGDIVVGTGRVALEAMSCGKPVLAVGNHGYFGPVVPDRYEGAWACYFGDHSSVSRPSEGLLAEALSGMCCDRSKLKSLGEQGQQWALQEFAIDIVAGQIARIYQSVQPTIAEKGRGAK
jgi:glycosyltransferase involved in cell wall biosynthesis